MSNWKRWPPVDDPNSLNWQFANIEHPERIIYPDIRDESRLVLASDYSGEHALPEFSVLAFLLVPLSSVMRDWEPGRLEVRRRYLTEGREMSFKKLKDVQRINALPSFLRAASRLNGVLVCISVEKSYSLQRRRPLPQLTHNWAASSLEKLIQICFFGGAIIDGLRGAGQHVHWITDDDAIVATEAAQNDALTLMAERLHQFPDEKVQLGLGVVSQFHDDDLRAADIVAIPDLAAGAISETLTRMGKANLPTSGSGPSGLALELQEKAAFINSWRSDNSRPLKHMNAVIRRAEDGRTLLSFGIPFLKVPDVDQERDGVPSLSSKWRKALIADWIAQGLDPAELLKVAGIDPGETGLIVGDGLTPRH